MDEVLSGKCFPRQLNHKREKKKKKKKGTVKGTMQKSVIMHCTVLYMMFQIQTKSVDGFLKQFFKNVD